MKRDERQKLLALSTGEARAKIQEINKDILLARQEKRLQDKTQVDLKRAYKLRKQAKMIKAELTRREIAGVQE